VNKEVFFLRLVFNSDEDVVGVVRVLIFDLVNIENWIRRRSYKLDGIGVGRIRTFPFFPIPSSNLSLMIQ